MKKIVLIAFLFSCCIAVDGQQSTLNLMPVPKEMLLKDGKFRLTNKFTIRVLPQKNDMPTNNGHSTDTILYKAINRFYQQLNRKTGLVFGQ